MTDLRRRSPAYPRNRGPILEVLKAMWGASRGSLRVLELASGPGEHVCYFAAELPHVWWQPTEPQAALRQSIDAWRVTCGLENVGPPLPLDVREGPWPGGVLDGALAINFFHMVDLETVSSALRGVGARLRAGGELAVYDCFTYGGEHVSESNAAFDARLRQTTAGGRVHEFEEVQAVALEAGFEEAVVHRLPANNQLVVWRRGGGA